MEYQMDQTGKGTDSPILPEHPAMEGLGLVRSTLDCLPQPAMILDTEYTIVGMNQVMAEWLGSETAFYVGKKCWEIFRSARCRNGCHMETTMARRKATIGNELVIQSASMPSELTVPPKAVPSPGP